MIWARVSSGYFRNAPTAVTTRFARTDPSESNLRWWSRRNYQATANKMWLRPVVSIAPGCARFSSSIASLTKD